MHTSIPARLVRACTLGLFSVCGLASSLLAGPPIKNPKDVVVETHPMYLGTITGGVKTSDVYTEGNFSIVAPVWSTLGADATLSGDVIYLEPYTSWGERGEVAASLGLGWRHLFGSQPVSALRNYDAPQAGFFDEGVFVGANLFVDMLDTEDDNQFWQLGVGLEVGTRYVEVRGNYYIPLSDKQLAEETRTVETIQRSSTSTAQSVTPTSAPYATGSSVAQDALFTTTATTFTSTTTIERLFRRYEEGMEGWDAEVAFLIPGLDRYFDLRVIGGYYKFDNQPFGPQEGGTGNVEGWKAGVEVRPVPAVILTGTWYDDERLTGSDWTVGVQLQIPFEAGDLGDGKTFWSRIGDSFTPRRRHLVERLAEPVRRQNAAIKVANTVDTETNTETSVKRTTKVVSRRPGQLVLADDIVFVNNGGAVGNGIQAGTAEVDGATGTAERPFNTITEGAFVAGTNSNNSGRLWTVYTQGGTGIDYEDSVLVTGSTRFTSSYVPIVGLGGQNFGGDTARPVVYGGFGAFGVNTLIVQGYDFRGGVMGLGTSIFAINPGTLIVTDNVFTPELLGGLPPFEEIPEFPELEELLPLLLSSVSVLADSEGGTHNIIVQNNEFNGVFAALAVASGSGFDLSDPLSFLESCGCGGGSSPIVNILATNNIINSAYLAGIYIDAAGGTILNSTISNNLFQGEFGTATLISSYDEAVVDVQLTGNVFDGFFAEGVSGFIADNDSFMNVNVAGNDILEGSLYGIGFGFITYGHATMTPTITNNFIGGESDPVYGGMIILDSDDCSTIIASIHGNIFEGEGCGCGPSTAIVLMSRYGSTLTADILGNTFLGTFDHALDADKRHGSVMTVNFSNNVLNGEFERDAIKLASHNYDDEGGSLLTATVTGNQFFGYYGESGMFLLAEQNAVLEGTVTGNVFHGEYVQNAIQLKSQKNGRLTATVADNVLAADGIVTDAEFLKARSNGASRLEIKGFDRNLALGSGNVGFFFREDDVSELTVEGTMDPAASNFVSQFFNTELGVSGDPSLDFFLNGGPVVP